MLSATKPELRDHLYEETTFQVSLVWSLNIGFTVVQIFMFYVEISVLPHLM